MKIHLYSPCLCFVLLFAPFIFAQTDSTIVFDQEMPLLSDSLASNRSFTVNASDGLYGSHVQISWIAQPNAIGYIVLRSTKDKRIAQKSAVITTMPQHDAWFADYTAEPGIYYDYQIKAVFATTPRAQKSSIDAGWIRPFALDEPNDDTTQMDGKK